MKTGREKLEKSRKIGILTMLAGVAVSVMAANNDALSVAYLGLAVAMAGLIYHTVTFRCPHCNSHLYVRAGIPDYCPHCGKKIE